MGSDAVVLIPSRKPDNLRAVVASLALSGWTGTTAVIDDGARDGAGDLPVTWLEGIKPFAWARNLNVGLRWAGDRDVIIVSDDVEIITPDCINQLIQEARCGNWAVLSPSIVGPVKRGPQRWRGGSGFVEATDLAFIMVAILNKTIATVGLFDERFVGGYGFDDTDYSMRVRQAGLRLGVTRNCVIYHVPWRATFDRSPESFKRHQQLFASKWGTHHASV